MKILISYIYKYKLKAFLLGIQIALLFLNLLGLYGYILGLNGIVVNNLKIIGGDFITFYAAGTLFNVNISQLYNFQIQKENLNSLFPQLQILNYGELPFVYPPIVAALFSIFANHAYVNAYLVYTLYGVVVSLGSLYVLLRYVFGKKNVIFLFCMLFLQICSFNPFFIETFVGGQLSWIGIVVYAMTALYLIKGRYFYAGLFFSLSYYKPPLFLISLFCFMLVFGLRFLKGFLVGATFIGLFSVVLVGIDPHVRYLEVVFNYTYGRSLYPGFSLPVSEGMGIYALISQLFEKIELSVLFVVSICLASLYKSYKFKKLILRDFDLKIIWLSLIIIISLAFSVQLIKYDLAMLLVPFFLISKVLPTMSNRNRNITVLCIIFAYLEFCFRRISLSQEFIVNFSMFNFIAIILLFYRIFIERLNHLNYNDE